MPEDSAILHVIIYHLDYYKDNRNAVPNLRCGMPEAGWQRPFGYKGSPVQHKCKGKQLNKEPPIKYSKAT